MPNRSKYLIAACFAGCMLIAILSLILIPGKTAAVLILDLNTPENQVFPYPFTIQNLMIFIFFLGVGDVLHRRKSIKLQHQATEVDLLPDGDVVLTRSELQPILKRAMDKGEEHPYYLCALIEQCILNYQANVSTSDAHDVLRSMVDMELHRVDLRYTLLRYVAWLIPTIGFIGTVVGIAQALGKLGSTASEGAMDSMSAVTSSLALAFNTTIIALVLSAVIVWLVQFTQQREEEIINANSDYCLRNLVNKLFTQS